MFGIGKFFRRDDKAKVEEQEAPRTEGDAPAGSEEAAPYEPDRAAEADFVPDPETFLEDAPAAEHDLPEGQAAAPGSVSAETSSFPADTAPVTAPPAAPAAAPFPGASPTPSGSASSTVPTAAPAAAPPPVFPAASEQERAAPRPEGAASPAPAAAPPRVIPAASEPEPSAPGSAATASPAHAAAAQPHSPAQGTEAAAPGPESIAPRSEAAAASSAHEPAPTPPPTSPPPSAARFTGAAQGTAAAYSPAEPPPAPVVPAAVPQPLTAARPSETARSGAAENGGFFSRLKAGLSKTRDNLAEGLSALVLGRKAIDEDLLEDIETQLLSADLGLEATTEVLEELRRRVKRKQLADADALLEALKQILFDLLEPAARPLELPPPGGEPFVILMVGVNGVGKTTTIGKLAKRYQQEGRDVLLAAGDTFRAAAVEQLQAWGEHNDVPVIAQHTGADSASVIFDAYQAARARRADVLIADTAGRLHTKSNLMQELEKVLRVLRKLEPGLPQEVLLVLDATTGQNALSQAKHFTEAVQVSGLVITKLDGSAKGGMVFAIAKQLDLPIRYIGIGERADDLRPFDARQFVDALFATR